MQWQGHAVFAELAATTGQFSRVRAHLTISSNLQKAVTSGALKRFGEHLIDDDEVEVCCLLALPSFERWYDDILPTLPKTKRSELTPSQEVDSVVRRFLLGKSVTEVARLQPTAQGVWEIRLEQTRLFGWFPQPDVFVLTDGDELSNVKGGTPGYAHYFQAVKTARKKLGLNYVGGDQSKVRPRAALGAGGGG